MTEQNKAKICLQTAPLINKTNLIKFTAIILCTFITRTEQLKFSSVQIPSLVQRNSNFWLSCQFQLDLVDEDEVEGDDWSKGRRRAHGAARQDQLYSVKWYKNNEEFYRLIFSPSASVREPKDLATDTGQQQFKQQYFAQSGVNVMMGSSNATHVRLLNASLDSEGMYACEISTQNLSTIRYEKEIRVYVLPSSRLNIIGFKNRYSLGDTVALICASDFSRPKPALAWFINGRRISAGDPIFELEAQSKSKSNDPTLFRLTLGLKFKLSSALVSALQNLDSDHLTRLTSRAGQTHGKQQMQASSGDQMQPIELQCRYKLTEISDVTYNEFEATRSRSAPPTQSALLAGRQFEGAKYSHNQIEQALKSGRHIMDSSSIGDLKVRVAKQADQQVFQSQSPAVARTLYRSLFTNQKVSSADTCQLGALALQPDDPLIVAPEFEADETLDLTPQPLEEESSSDLVEGAAARRRKRSQSIGGMMRVNCSTISAVQMLRQFGPEQSVSPLFCSDTGTRRRLVISGHSQAALGGGTANESSVVGITTTSPQASTNRPRAGSRLKESSSAPSMGRSHALAYLSLEGVTYDNNKAHHKSETSASIQTTMTNADSADFVARLRSLSYSSSRSRSTNPNSMLVAPPLLEWFINNQEATKTSVSYAPDLPLVHYGEHSALDGHDSDMDAADVAKPPPAIDYAEYFANFDARPMQQYLMLRLKLDKTHFMTPDSSLKLRCSSTQAQVLAVDVASATILPAGPNHNPQHLLQAWQKQGQKLKSVRHGESIASSRSASTKPTPLISCRFLIITLVVAITISLISNLH